MKPQYKLIYDLLRDRWYLIIMVLISGILSSYLTILVPVFIGDAIDSVPRYYKIFDYIILILIVSSLSSLFGFILEYYSSKTGNIFARRIRDMSFKRVLSNSYDKLENQDSGDLLSRITMDVDASRRFVTISISNLFSTTALLFIALYELTRIYYLFSIIFLIVMVPTIYLTFKMQRMQRGYWRSLRKKYGNMNSKIGENISGMRVVRSFNAEDFEIKSFKDKTQDYFSDYVGIAAVRSFYTPLLAAIISISIGFIIITSGISSAAGIPIGSIVAAINIFTLVLRPVRFYGRYISFYENGMASLERLSEIDYSNENYSKKEPTGYDIIIENLSFFRNNKKIINNISLNIHENEHIALTGGTASGKTTFLNLISGLYKNYDGSIRLGGIEIRDISPGLLRRIIGIIPQNPFIFSGSIFYNIDFGRGYSLSQVINAARLAKIDDFIETLPDKYNTVIGEHGINLSGGQRQRIALARALIGDPKILVMDDFTSSLDIVTEEELINDIRPLLDGKTVVISGYKKKTLELADDVYYMSNGALLPVESGVNE